jgi:hypothetical protein
MRATSSAFLVLPLLTAGACMDSSAPSTGDATTAITCGDPTYFRIDRVTLPEAPGGAEAVGLDLNGDGVVDNAIGNVLGAIVSTNPDIGSISAKASARVAGDVTWELALSQCDDGTQHVELGNSGGLDTVPLTIVSDPSGTFGPVAWVRADHLVAHVAMADQTVDGVVGFTLPMPEAGPALVAPFAAYLSRELAAGTSPIAAELDKDHDGTVTPAELLASDLGTTLLMPDMTLDGTPSLSVGLRVHGTRVP